ncbi:uncharacterized protein LOC18441957 [Amborella trichopoda]|uniref:Uncharacterized protein n=1 Tax=Amborella trichopoda TaxID=13333 RepID=W1Q0V0_AMBTC|nr:uncharacterized protein LOC18441957 [Amborella trichopoda]ERN13710.1 hypothetical protein AMTR_s00049p00156610 [Amborella trichopoda]|eukprot:XP_020527573.1 uncharacterized protein LOC18441957 [Amborella trichopoda]
MPALSPPLPHPDPYPDPDPDPCQRPLPQARKARSKTRKPKFLSLDRTHSPNPPDSPLHLFPLHPEINQDEPTSSSPNLEDNVAWLLEPEPSFSSEETAMSSLFSGEISGGDCPNQETFDFTETMGGKDLEATALRKRSEEREEKWVFCKPWGDEEVNQGLCLKLDYEEILNAWSDKGSLYIEGEGPQTVPQEQPNVSIIMVMTCIMRFVHYFIEIQLGFLVWDIKLGVIFL